MIVKPVVAINHSHRSFLSLIGLTAMFTTPTTAYRIAAIPAMRVTDSFELSDTNTYMPPPKRLPPALVA